MRTDRRYTRVRAMLTAPEVPRTEGGGIALCHFCQRAVYWAGGFMQYLIRRLETTVFAARAPGACPKCGKAKLYRIARFERQRCAACHHEFSETTGTALYKRKKPKAWYKQIIELHNQGLNPRQISKRLGCEAKSVYAFLRRHELSVALTAPHRDGEK